MNAHLPRVFRRLGIVFEGGMALEADEADGAAVGFEFFVRAGLLVHQEAVVVDVHVGGDAGAGTDIDVVLRVEAVGGEKFAAVADFHIGIGEEDVVVHDKQARGGSRWLGGRAVVFMRVEAPVRRLGTAGLEGLRPWHANELIKSGGVAAAARAVAGDGMPGPLDAVVLDDMAVAAAIADEHGIRGDVVQVIVMNVRLHAVAKQRDATALELQNLAVIDLSIRAAHGIAGRLHRLRVDVLEERIRPHHAQTGEPRPRTQRDGCAIPHWFGGDGGAFASKRDFLRHNELHVLQRDLAAFREAHDIACFRGGECLLKLGKAADRGFGRVSSGETTPSEAEAEKRAMMNHAATPNAMTRGFTLPSSPCCLWAVA